MTNPPCPVTKSAGPSQGQGPIYERGLFSKLCFPCAILGGWGCSVLFLREPGGVKPGRGSRGAWAAGGWLCPLLDKARPAEIFPMVDIQEPADSFAQRNIAFRKQFQPNIFKPAILLRTVAANLHSRSESAGREGDDWH